MHSSIKDHRAGNRAIDADPYYLPHPSCQIPRLAFDGELCSNTSFLADLGRGNVLTTADAETAQAYGQIEWAKGFLNGETVSVRQVRLEAILRNEGIPVGFDLLVVDVEGGEEGVFMSFDLASWKPSMIIVELEDAEPSMQPFPSLTARAARVRDLIGRHGYSAIYRDTINTVFWTPAA